MNVRYIAAVALLSTLSACGEVGGVKISSSLDVSTADVHVNYDVSTDEDSGPDEEEDGGTDIPRGDTRDEEVEEPSEDIENIEEDTTRDATPEVEVEEDTGPVIITPMQCDPGYAGEYCQLISEIPLDMQQCNVKNGLALTIMPWALAWFTALHTGQDGEPSSVEVRNVQLWITTADGEDHLIAGAPENGHGIVWGGLWGIWFKTNDSSGVSIYGGDSWLADTGSHPDRIIHFGTSRAKTLESILDLSEVRVWTSAEVKITGPAIIQLGIDFWVGQFEPWNGLNVNNTEAAISDWAYNQTEEWQVITANSPHDPCGN